LFIIIAEVQNLRGTIMQKFRLRITSLLLVLFSMQTLYIKMPVRALAAAPASSATSEQTQTVVFNDDKLRAKIIEALDLPNDTVLTSSQLAALTELDLSDSGISDLEGLQYAVNLTALIANDNDIKTLDPIKALNNLSVLSLQSNYIKDINAVQNMTNLGYLNLSDNYIISIDALKGLTDLEVIGLNANLISDLSPLKALTKLSILDLSSNVPDDITQISALTNLELLSLAGNNISDISVLKNMTKLQVLELQNNSLTDISVLDSLKAKGAFNFEDSIIVLSYNYLNLSSGSQQESYYNNLKQGGTEVHAENQFSALTPKVKASNPANGEQAFSAKLPITVQFDKAVEEGENIDYMGIISEDGDEISVSASIDNDIVTLTPEENLQDGKKYIIQIATGAFKSKADGSISDDFVAIFTTADDAANKYTVTFNSNGGSEVANQVVSQNSKVSKPVDPTRGGYKFGGWYTDQYPFKTLFDFSKSVQDSNVTLYARWIPTEAYIVSYIQQTEDTKLFGVYNQAKAVIYESDLSEEKKGYYLGQLAKYDSVVFTDINKYFIDRCIEIAANPNLTDFLALVDEIDAKLTNDIDKGYFKGQMNSWGRYQVYTPEVQASIDAIVEVWTVKTTEAVEIAKTAIAKVKQPGSVTWLNSSLDEAVQAISK
jgi:internalin A